MSDDETIDGTNMKDRPQDLWDAINRDGVQYIDYLINEQITEELYLDYKVSEGNGSGNKLSDSDKNNLAKCISGFGNSSGGIVVWGVDCRDRKNGKGDVPVSRPIERPNRFKGWIESLVSGMTLPAHGGVKSLALALPGPDDLGYVITFIPQSMTAPHQVVTNREYRYYIRAGSSFLPAPHDVLSGMFGRRPQAGPVILYLHNAKRVNNGVMVEFGITMRNNGRGIGRDLFVNCETHLPGKNCRMVLSEQVAEVANWDITVGFGYATMAIAKPHIRLPPGGMRMPLVFELLLVKPFSELFSVQIQAGCEGTRPFIISSKVSPNVVDIYYNQHFNGMQSQESGVDIFQFPDSVLSE